MTIDDRTRVELEAAVYRRLVEHLRQRADVQNLDLMNLAGFCRNCLSDWMEDVAHDQGRESGSSLRHALRRMAQALPARREPRAAGRLRQVAAKALARPVAARRTNGGMRVVVRLRQQDTDERKEHEALVELYRELGLIEK